MKMDTGTEVGSEKATFVPKQATNHDLEGFSNTSVLKQVDHRRETQKLKSSNQLGSHAKRAERVDLIKGISENVRIPKEDLKTGSSKHSNSVNTGKPEGRFFKASPFGYLHISGDVANTGDAGLVKGQIKLEEFMGKTKENRRVADNLRKLSEKEIDFHPDGKKKMKVENVKIEIDISKKARETYKDYKRNDMEFREIFKRIQEVKEELNILKFSKSLGKSENTQKTNSSLGNERVRVEEIIDRISRILELKKNEPRLIERAKIDLEPPNLGKLVVEISKEDKSVAIVFRVTSQKAKEIVERKIDTLVHRLTIDGFDVGKVDVKFEKQEREENLPEHQENEGQREKHENGRRRKREEGEDK